MPVVNIRDTRCQVYVGRFKDGRMHFGNPFSHVKHEHTIYVPTREIAVATFEKWLFEEEFLDVEPVRRKWIQDNLHSLKGMTLGCYCAPLLCHGNVLERVSNES